MNMRSSRNGMDYKRQIELTSSKHLKRDDFETIDNVGFSLPLSPLCMCMYMYMCLHLYNVRASIFHSYTPERDFQFLNMHGKQNES